MITEQDIVDVFEALELEVPTPIPPWVIKAVRILLDDIKPVAGSFVLSESQRTALGAPQPLQSKYEAARMLLDADFGHRGAELDMEGRPPPGSKKTHCIKCGEYFYDDARPNETRMILRCPFCNGSWYQ